MEIRTNDSGRTEHFVEGHHLNLKNLRAAARGVQLERDYLYKTNIPAYPRPKFHVSRLKHDTNKDGLEGIRGVGGFMKKTKKDRSLLWFSLEVGPEEIQAAERRLLEITYPDRTEEQIQNQPRFLKDFASSPVFQRTSRYGSYRFTFSVEEVLKAYKDQFCSGDEPVMRVMKTVLYRQEVMYVVLVHSRDDEELYSEYPLLADNPDPICTFRDGCFQWRSEAMCETHKFELVQNDAEKRMETKEAGPEYYVWDHVAIALHLGEQVLKFDLSRLREKLTFCEKEEVTVVPRNNFQNLQTAREIVAKLWPGYPTPLMRDGETTQEVPQEDKHPTEASQEDQHPAEAPQEDQHPTEATAGP